MRFTLIYNPVSGRGAGSRAAARARKALEVSGHEVELAAAAPDAPAVALAQRAAEE
ncbi:MAG: sphingosine kinase, partial [Gemmatimonadetes bacterium]|nr:sphingosine kinase [Gemmatimonadota bacterium]